VTPPIKSWRDVLPVHPAANLFPPMSKAEIKELAEDIKKNGLQSPITTWTDPADDKRYVLDGCNRLDALELIGEDTTELLLVSNMVREEPSSVDPWAYVVSANIHRRHQSAEGKHDTMTKLLKAKPEASDRAIAKQIKVDHKTVGKARAELEGRGEIPHVEKRTDTKGRKQPSSKPKKATAKLHGASIDVSKFSPKAQAAIAAQTGEIDIEVRKAEMAKLDKQPDDPSPEELAVQRFIFAADRVIETAKDAGEFLSKVQLSEESTAKIGEAVDRVIAAWQWIKERRAEYAASETAAA
jgi:hypothetical protein